MQAMIALPDGTMAKVNVYRNGNVVTIVGVAKHQTPAGTSETVVQSRMTVETFEWYREKATRQLAAARGTLAYGRILRAVGVTDADVNEAVNLNVLQAPPLPVKQLKSK